MIKDALQDAALVKTTGLYHFHRFFGLDESVRYA
jgi:hypothetical protein